MDGVLIDSEIYWENINERYFRLKGVSSNSNLLKKLMGRDEMDIARILKDDFDFKDSVGRIIKERKSLSEEIYTQRCAPLNGADKLIKRIYGKGLSLAVASSSELERIELIVDRFNWNKYFSFLISSDKEDFPGKPAPDIYLHTAKRFHIEPENCLVFEDSENGIVAAKKAGMQCVAVLDRRWEHGDTSSADLSVESLEDEAIYKFLNLHF